MKAMLLAAGEGRRMRPLTLDLPKPLLQAGGKSLLFHHLAHLESAGFDSVVVNVAYLADKIVQALASAQASGIPVMLSREEQPLETGGGIKRALPLLGENAFALVNSDIWSDFDLKRLLRIETSAQRLAHLVLVENPPHNPGGDFMLNDEGYVVAINPQCPEQPTYTFAGISVIDPQLMALFPEAPEKFPLLTLLLLAIEKKAVSAEVHRGLWMDIGTPERLEQLNALLCCA